MTMLAQNTFTVKRATKDGYSCSLSSYSVMLNADSNGVVNGLSAASTTVKLYQGSTAVTPVISIDSVSNCSASISGLNVSIVSVPNNTKSGYVDVKVVYGSFVKIERYTFTVVDYTIVKSYTQTIVGDQMTSYATKDTVDTLGKTVLEQSTKIEQNSKDIALKASQLDVDNLGGRMKTAEASIKPDAICLTVAQQTANIASYMRGKMLYRDPTFSSGNNGTNVYNNSGGGTVTVVRTSGISGNPNNSGYCLKIDNTGTASPGLGGFYFGTQTRAGAILVTRIIANIPIGYTINWASNAYGSGGSLKWLTSQKGTGTWTEYVCVVTCGTTGTFSSTNFFYLTGSGTVTWYVAYATVFDTTEVDDTPTTDEIKAQFTIDTDGISMLGKKISLTGIVSFKSLSDYSDVNRRISAAQDTADNAKNSLGTLTTNLRDLAYKSKVEEAMKEEGLISGAFIKMSLIDVKNVVAQGISAQTIDAGNATLKNLTVDTATVKMATLIKASGTFTELRCVNDKGSEVFSFNSTAVNIESVDMYNQGTKDGRALRFYASDIRCRGSLGAYTRNYVIVNMGIASYYVNGDTTSSVKVNLGTTTYNGRTYYMIPLYPAYGESGLSAISATGNCKINDVYGFPVDEVIIINNAGSYYYNLIGYAGKKVTLVNATDSFNNNYFASCENAAHQLKGGVTMSLINVNPFFMSGSRTINSIDKSCWMIAGWYDNDFN